MTVAAVIAVAGIVFAASALQAVAGFGFSLFAVPLLSFPLDAKVAVVVAGTAGLASSGTNAWHERRHRDRACVRRMVLGAAAGSPIGFVLLDRVPERGLRLALAGAIAVFVVLNIRAARRPIRRVDATATSRPTAAEGSLDTGAGFVSGVLNTMLSTGGPPIVAVLHARRLPPERFRATLSAVFAMSGLLAIALYVGGDRYTARALEAIVVAVPMIVVGQVLGARWRGRVAPVAFRRGVTVLLVATALASAVAALAG